MHVVTLDEAKKTLAELLEEVQAGTEIIILHNNAPAALLVPAIRPGFGSLRGQIVMAEDFDAPLEDLADYMP